MHRLYAFKDTLEISGQIYLIGKGSIDLVKILVDIVNERVKIFARLLVEQLLVEGFWCV